MSRCRIPNPQGSQPVAVGRPIRSADPRKTAKKVIASRQGCQRLKHRTQLKGCRDAFGGSQSLQTVTGVLGTKCYPCARTFNMQNPRCGCWLKFSAVQRGVHIGWHPPGCDLIFFGALPGVSAALRRPVLAANPAGSCRISTHRNSWVAHYVGFPHFYPSGKDSRTLAAGSSNERCSPMKVGSPVSTP